MAEIEREWSVRSADGEARWPAKNYEDACRVRDGLPPGEYAIEVRQIAYGNWGRVDI